MNRTSKLLFALALIVGALVTACSVEVNINTHDHDEDGQATVQAPSADAPATQEAEPREALPPLPPAPAPGAPIMPRLPSTEAPVVRDALLRDWEERAPGNPSLESLIGEAPQFTPFTVAPSILNRSEVVRAMEANYPPLLRDAGIGGSTRVYFLISETGEVADFRIDQSSGHQALDLAALAVADVYRFSPAKNRDVDVPVWVSFPITFQVRPPPAASPNLADLREGGPEFTPFTVAPAIVNRDDVVAAMEANYPPLLREAGIGGTVRVYFLISETGRVADFRIDKSSGHPALDDAALAVADVYRFTAARNRDRDVPVWVSFPITFQTGG